MSDEYTIEATVDGATRTITLSQPLGFQYLSIVAAMPGGVRKAVAEGDDPEMDAELVGWLRSVVAATTDLPDDDLDAIAPCDIGNVVNASLEVFGGNAPSASTDAFRLDADDPFAGLDLNDDGTLDPEDYR